jgi:hypothetical protein
MWYVVDYTDSLHFPVKKTLYQYRGFLERNGKSKEKGAISLDLALLKESELLLEYLLVWQQVDT